eukprot:717662_1
MHKHQLRRQLPRLLMAQKQPQVKPLMIYCLMIFIALVRQNDLDCTAQDTTMTFDDSTERDGVSTVLDNTLGGPICCRGYSACYSNNIQYTSFIGERIICSGHIACSSSNIFNDIMIIRITEPQGILLMHLMPNVQ